MTGTLVPNTVCFVSRTTLASLVDLHYVVKGFNEDELIPLNQLLGTRPILPFTGADEIARTGFGSNPFGANKVLNQSGAATQSRQSINVYKKRRK